MRNCRGSDLKHSSGLYLALLPGPLVSCYLFFQEENSKDQIISFICFSNQVWKPSPPQDLELSGLGGPWKVFIPAQSSVAAPPTLPHSHFTGQAPRTAVICSKSHTNQMVASVLAPNPSSPLPYHKFWCTVFFYGFRSSFFEKRFFFLKDIFFVF